MIYLLIAKPYQDPFTTRVELFNECCILLVGYQLFVFTDFVDSPEVKSLCGYLMIGSVLLNFGVNLAI